MINNEFLTIAATCLLIFCARIMDVSIGTMRIIFVSKGYRKLAPVLGFIEVFIWIMAISRIMQHIDRFAYYIAYAAGFATGNWIGMLLESRLAIGIEKVRFYCSAVNRGELEQLIPDSYTCISYAATRNEESITVFEITSNRKKITHLVSAISARCPHIEYIREEVKATNFSLVK